MRADVRKLIKDAEMAFIRRQPERAKGLCKQALALDPKCGRAHAILGDIYRAKRMNERAIQEYSYAIQFNPNDRESEEKLNKLIERSAPISFSWEDHDGTLSKSHLIASTVGWTIAVFALFFIWIFPGTPIPWLVDYRLTYIAAWSWNVVFVIFGDSLLMGFLLGFSGLLEHPDDAIIYERGASGWTTIHTGLLLVITGPLFFPAAAIVYLVFAFIQNALSKSIVTVLTVATVVTTITALLYPPATKSILLLGGNIAFVGVMIGWTLGSILTAER